MTVYTKTATGQREIQSRAHPLPPKTRQALILVDGKRDDAVLSELITDSEHCAIDTLLDLGLIEPSQVIPLDDAAALQAPVRAVATLDGLRRSLVRALNEALGPEAETLALRAEKAKTLDELSALIGQAAHLVRSARGDEAGIEFAGRFTRPRG